MTLLQVGRPAPKFRATNLTGSDVTLEDYNGKAVVLVFVPDRFDPKETKSLMSLYNNRDRRLEMINVVRKVPSVSMAKAYYGQLGVKFPILYDQAMEMYRNYGVQNPVAIFIIDAVGNIAHSEQIDPKGGYIERVQYAMANAVSAATATQVQCPNCRGFKVRYTIGVRYVCDICGYQWEQGTNNPPIIGGNPDLLQLGAEHLKRVEDEERRQAAAKAAAEEKQRRQQEAAAAAWWFQQQQNKK